MTEPSPPRLHVLLARDAPVGVVIRRGPSKVTATFLWDRANDTFTLGQWVKARIYEHRSDLSPDGKHLIYFALTGKWQSEVKGTYTAISRAPYLKAITLYAKGDTWGGGGGWLGNHEYYVNHLKGHRVVHHSSEVRAQSEIVGTTHAADPITYAARLMRLGWQPTKESVSSKTGEGVYSKAGPTGWLLTKRFAWNEEARGGANDLEENSLVFENGTTLVQPDWEWADMDRGRLVWATEGRIETGVPTEKGMVDVRVLHDFNGMSFKAVKAPY